MRALIRCQSSESFRSQHSPGLISAFSLLCAQRLRPAANCFLKQLRSALRLTSSPIHFPEDVRAQPFFTSCSSFFTANSTRWLLFLYFPLERDFTSFAASSLSRLTLSLCFI